MSPIDPKMKAHIRPRYIELLKLQGPKQMDMVARRFFARKEAIMRAADPSFKVTRSEFWEQFAIDIEKCVGFFMEVGGTPNIRGAYFPTEKVRPILTIQRSRSGRTWKIVSQSCPGFLNNAMDTAWVEVDVYEEMLGDTFYEELEESAEKNVANMKKSSRSERRREEKRRKVKVRNWMRAKKDYEKKQDG